MDQTQRGRFVPDAEMARQTEYALLCRELLSARSDAPKKAYVHTYGCQGNVADSERIKGQLREIGYGFTETPDDADLILFNTCAVREHAEDRVFGNVGALKRLKAEKKDALVIALCGCMVQQPHIAEKLRKSYPYVDLIFGTFAIHRVPELLYRVLSAGRRLIEITPGDGSIAEGLPVERDRGVKAWLPVMYGCNNFCSYCIVPYVRGRERSRTPDAVLAEARALVSDGAKDITLLGQNVNSYGNGCGFDADFPTLLRRINDIPGDFRIRFMTSHPKDCTPALLDAMADCEKVAKHLHLPVQSGSDAILKRMNRHYDRAKYLSLIEYARKVMPELSITSDIIVGFPGETREDFEQTLDLVRRVEYTSLFTFIYSKRQGTPAAAMDDPTPPAEKSARFRELCGLQEEIASRRTAAMKDRVFRVLTEPGDEEGLLCGRTEGNVIIKFPGDPALIGQFTDVRVTRPRTWMLYGEQA